MARTHGVYFILTSLLFLSSLPSLNHLKVGGGFPVASHLTVSLLPSSTRDGFLIRFNFGAAAVEREREREGKLSVITSQRKKLDYCNLRGSVRI